MQAANPDISSTLIDTFNSFIDSFSRQLASFQKTIITREEGKNAPTVEEINMQHKLLGCIDKLVRYIKKEQPTQVITGFITHVSKGDKELAGKVKELYAQYTQKQPHNKVAPHTTENQLDNYLENSALNTTAGIAATSNIAPHQQISVVITKGDFENHKKYLGKDCLKNITNKTTIKFNGRQVNAKWLEYNLFQYCLPPAERKFIDDARKVISDINHQHTQAAIRDYLAVNPVPKIAA